MKNTDKRGGKREGSGRKEKVTKQFSVWCHPDVIKSVREFAKIESDKVI